MRIGQQSIRARWACVTLAVCCAGWPCGRLWSDGLDDIMRRGTLVWGADKEGGGPYVYPRDDLPDEIQGFEVELAELLARRLRVRAEFAQNPWAQLPEVLNRGGIDIVLNGYEWTASRGERFNATIPYYIYELQLLARADDRQWQRIEDLAQPREDGRPFRVAVLGGSAAELYLTEHFPDTVQVVRFEGSADAMRAVELGVDGLDATLQDLPIVTFFENEFRGLARVGQPVGAGYYVILVRRGEQRLTQALNDAIAAALADGSLREILSRYRLWNDTQRRRALETDHEGRFVGDEPGVAADRLDGPADTRAFERRRGMQVMADRGMLLVRGAWMTVKLAFVSMPLAILLGLVVAVARMFGTRPVQWLATTYIEVVRGTPLVLQLYLIFFLLPELGLSIPAFWAAITGLAINYSAYEAEIYRAGIQAVPRGQWEAATALGMSRATALRRIILPQATRLAIPPVTNDFIALFKDTAVCSIITVVELSKEYSIHAQSTGAIVELGALTAVLYLAMSYPLALVARGLERRLAKESGSRVM